MARKSYRRGNGPVPTHFGRLPTGPGGPRPRPTSWAAGIAPFGRLGLTLSPGISGGQRTLLTARTMTTFGGRTA